MLEFVAQEGLWILSKNNLRQRREKVPLASSDKDIIKAAKKHHIEVFH